MQEEKTKPKQLLYVHKLNLNFLQNLDVEPIFIKILKNQELVYEK